MVFAVSGVDLSYTRETGSKLTPKEWIAKMPNIALDGEMWTGRDEFHKCVTITIHREHGWEDWKKVKYMVFDAPMVKGTFEERIKFAKEKCGKNDIVSIIEQKVCTSVEQLEQAMDKICKGKGEGIMLKDPKSMYENKRSYSLLKVKRFEDAEATVIDHVKGTGRLWNLCGAILCREKDGTEFKIGSGFDDAQRRKPPKIGSVVTFKF